MSSSFIQQLLDALVTPYALVAMVVAVVVLELAEHYRPFAWSLFSLCCFTSSLGVFDDEWNGRGPRLVFPLEQLRSLGRPLTIALVALILIIGLIKRGGPMRLSISRPAIYLFVVQVLIFLKTMNAGNMGFALMAIGTFGAVVLMILLGPDRWLQEESNFHFGVRALALVTVVFVLLSAYQAVFDVGAITFPHGRLIGTTDNAQHAAVALALTVPCFMFLIERREFRDIAKIAWIAGLAAVLIALVMTGSRTGGLMALVSILVFFRRRLGKLFLFAIGAGVIAVFVTPYLLQHMGISDSDVGDFYMARGNTRADSWQGMWEKFTADPLFGAPLEGGRPTFAENSWLAVAAVLGLSGLIPLLLFGYETVKMMKWLTVRGRSHPAYALHVSTIVAGLTALFMGSLLECFLLGSLTFPLFALLLFLSLGKNLLESIPAETPEVPRPAEDQTPSAPTRRPGPVKRAIAIR